MGSHKCLGLQIRLKIIQVPISFLRGIFGLQQITCSQFFAHFARHTNGRYRLEMFYGVPVQSVGYSKRPERGCLVNDHLTVFLKRT